MHINITNNYLFLCLHILLEYSEVNNINIHNIFNLLNVTLVHYNVIWSLHQVRIGQLVSHRCSHQTNNKRLEPFNKQNMPH